MLDSEFYDRPVHGPLGRIAFVRNRLGMRQVDFAAAIGSSRETVSHWENLAADGSPQQRTNRRSARAIAELVRGRLGHAVDESVFFRRDDSALDAVHRELLRLSEQQERLVETLDRVVRLLAT
jgi:DNA-binding XRE family transcriptional regulator